MHVCVWLTVVCRIIRWIAMEKRWKRQRKGPKAINGPGRRSQGIRQGVDLTDSGPFLWWPDPTSSCSSRLGSTCMHGAYTYVWAGPGRRPYSGLLAWIFQNACIIWSISRSVVVCTGLAWPSSLHRYAWPAAVNFTGAVHACGIGIHPASTSLHLISTATARLACLHDWATASKSAPTWTSLIGCAVLIDRCCTWTIYRMISAAYMHGTNCIYIYIYICRDVWISRIYYRRPACWIGRIIFFNSSLISSHLISSHLISSHLISSVVVCVYRSINHLVYMHMQTASSTIHFLYDEL